MKKRSKLFDHLTYANVMVTFLAFIVLGGGAAFAALGKGTVGTRQLKKNAVKVGKLGPEAVKAGKLAQNAVPTNRIRNNAVSSSKVASGSILTDKIAAGAVTSSRLGNNAVIPDKIADNAVTEQKVGTDAIGAPQLKSIVVRSNSVVIPNGGSGVVSANCESGEQVVGAGTSWAADGEERYTNYAHITGNGAIARGNQLTGSSQTFSVEAYCLSG